MIDQIKLQNVRIFDDKLWVFDLPKVSIFCGTNSSGKSTILKSLLLLRQSQGIGERIAPTRGRLRFVGSQVDLGNYLTFISSEDLSKDMYLSISIRDWMYKRNYDAYISLYDHQKNPEEEQKVETSKDDQSRVEYCLSVDFIFAHDDLPTNLLSAEAFEDIRDIGVQGVLKYAQFHVFVDNHELLEWDVILHTPKSKGKTKKESTYYIRIPELLFKDEYSNLISRIYKSESPRGDQQVDISILELGITDIKELSKENYVVLPVMLNGLLPERISPVIKPKDKSGQKRRTKRETRFTFPFPPPYIIYYILNDLNTALGRIQYLGPLRSPAQRYYVTLLDTNPQMDPAGEFLPYIFRDILQGKKYIVDYVSPGFQTSIDREVPLIDALNSWMYYIRTGKIPDSEFSKTEIEVERTKILLEFRVKSIVGEERHALADSGFGYSQVLPILIRGLMAHSGSTLVVEQPELHLNPALQVRLAEFLLSLSRVNKQVIIETHSEHIVNTIRVLIAEDETGELSNISKIYYVDIEYGKPKVYELSIQPDGTVPKWPQSFFGEAASITGRLLRAQKKTRSQKN